MYVGKKAMNTIEGPVSPWIQKDPPRFYKTNKHWTVDVGNTIKDQQDNDQSLGGAILAVSRDENQNRYGKASYIPKVNKNFRPPLVDPEYDLVALSRIPRPRTQLRINPISLAQTQNAHGTDVSSYIDERVMLGNVRPQLNLVYNYEKYNYEDVILPDLQFKLPQTSAKLIKAPNIIVNNQDGYEINLNRKNPHVVGHANYENPFKGDALNSLEDLELEYNNPQVSGTSGYNSQFSQNQQYDVELDRRDPYVVANSGFETGLRNNNLTMIEGFELERKDPQVSGRSGINTDIRKINEMGDIQLDRKDPHVIAKSGNNTQLKNNNLTMIEDLSFDTSYKGPQVSGKSGVKSDLVKSNQGYENDIDLKYNNPQVSVKAQATKKLETYNEPQQIKTINPIQLDYKLTKNLGIKQNNINENPHLRNTLQVNGSLGSNPPKPKDMNIPLPKLRPKK
jgi:hypothetical protein